MMVLKVEPLRSQYQLLSKMIFTSISQHFCLL
jgi:hypothetical protein